MGKQFFELLLIATLFHISQQKSTPNDPTYKGAVVEYFPCNQPSPENILLNYANYREYIVEASKAGADIIVFPEIGLVGYGNFMEEYLQLVPDPKDKFVACGPDTTYGQIVHLLSCEASSNKIYVVVNLPEKVPCSNDTDKNCPESGRYRYNTNVVFDRNGAVVARYRKYNLFDEGDTNIPPEPESVYFDTDFGVRFGTFICFDILFPKPAIDLVKNHGITDIVFSTAWFGELPFLTALQAQQGWAYANDVNFLGSGYNNVSVGSGGSGIYPGKSDKFTHISPEETTNKLLIFEVNKKTKTPGLKTNFKKLNPNLQRYNSNIHQRLVRSIPMKNVDCEQWQQGKYSLNLLTDVLDVYESHVLDVNEDKGALEKTVCDGDFCCNFTISYERPKSVSHNYRAVAFNGVRKYGATATGGVQICSVLLCTGPNITDCKSRLPEKDFGYTFSKIMITGDFIQGNASQMPSTLIDGIELAPLSPSQFEFNVVPNGDENSVQIELKSKQTNLMTFGIYGRVFSRDGEPPTMKGSGNALRNAIFLTLTSWFIIMYLK